MIKTSRFVLFVDSDGCDDAGDGGGGHKRGGSMEDVGVGVEMAEVEVEVEYGRGRG